MKRVISLAIGIVAVCTFAMCIHSCMDNTANNEKEAVITSEVYRDYEIIIIDSCEYIRGYRTLGYRLAHKGNCRFCKERRKKELEDLVDALKENNYDNN